ncbi:MAG: NAD(P)H-hydrate epimerase [Candidatus Omnitrophica bacterium]|nr:NAD(P)H-hydrate epimerase [Candidatus Omnitrophota bacterium]
MKIAGERAAVREVTRKEMREIDREAIEKYKIPSLILMENAGLCVAEAIETRKGVSIAVVCGKGNNGGDGLVAARHLANHGYKVKVFLLTPKEAIKGDSSTNLAIWEAMGGPVSEVLEEKDMRSFRSGLEGSSVIVDAIFGTGLEKEVTGFFRSVIDAINESRKAVVAVDIPSGLCADTGRVMGSAVRAAITVTLGLPKRGFRTNEGPKYCGEVKVADISLPASLIKGF